MHAVDADEENVLVARLHRGPTVIRQSDSRRKEARSKHRRHKRADTTAFHGVPSDLIELHGGPRTTAQCYARFYAKFAKLKRRQRYGNTKIV
jgi:hypothetical protein